MFKETYSRYETSIVNLLHIIKLYWDLKDNPDKDMVLVYHLWCQSCAWLSLAKSVIKLITLVANLANNDESLQGKLKVVFS